MDGRRHAYPVGFQNDFQPNITRKRLLMNRPEKLMNVTRSRSK